MDKKNKYIYYLPIFFILFLFFCSTYCFAADLEIQYPTLSNGGTLTSQTPLTGYLKYVFDFGMVLGTTLAIATLIFAGALYILSSAFPSLQAKAKDRALGALYGLLLLFLLYLIITAINPQLSIFATTNLTTYNTPKPLSPAGVSFYNTGDCKMPFLVSYILSPTLYTSPIPDLKTVSNLVTSVGIAQQPQTDTYYLAVLFSSLNYTGKCQYIDPNSNCTTVDPFASSAAIYKYNMQPGGGNVTFFRRSYYNSDGGSLSVNVSGNYVHKLSDLHFKNVPKDEQDCLIWDLKGQCAKKTPPDLSEDHINSIQINGNYIVLLVYFSSTDKPKGIWSYCQIFPTVEDANKDGPKQIKWEYIRQNNQYPNYVVILPVVDK